MPSKPPRDDVGDRDLQIGPPERVAAGMAGIAHALTASVAQMGVRRTALTLHKVNQDGGFDCPGCAWPEPEPGRRSHTEFCENGAKAVADEATLRRIGPEFFAAHPIGELAQRSAHWLGQQGRLTAPMVRRPGAAHYTPISWDEAFAIVARELRAVASPDEAVFYTSGRTSNEAAFLYQLFARAYGTNNLPDCSNMCHESSGVALTATIGVGKGSVTLDDIHRASLIVVVGQNPGTNHPRMLGALEEAKRRGARILAVNPLPEAGLIRFRNPQRVDGLLGQGTALADRFLQIRVGGDLALFRAIGSLLVQWGAVDEVVRRHVHRRLRRTTWRPCVRLDWADVAAATGLTRGEIVAAAKMFADSDATIVCWAMGLTQRQRLGGRDPRDRQRPAAARHARPAGRRPVPGARALQRAGRPHDGHRATARRRGRARSASGCRSRHPPARGTTRSRRSGPCATAGPGCSWRSAATSPRPARTPR